MPTPKKTNTKETAAVTPVRAAKPKAAKTSPVVEVVSEPRISRVKSVKHSKATAPVVTVEKDIVEEAIVETASVSAHDQIAKIAYGYWEARGFQPGCPEQDWLLAEQEYLNQLA